MKQRQKDMLREVVSYCQNDLDCRRTQVLQYFDEKFSAEDCHGTCDNCADKSDSETRDITKEAQIIISIGKCVANHVVCPDCGTNILAVRDTSPMKQHRPTVSSVVNLWRGSMNQKSKQLINYPWHGRGKEYNKSDATRMLQHLVSSNILVDKTETTKLGYSVSYLHVSSASPCTSQDLIESLFSH